MKVVGARWEAKVVRLVWSRVARTAAEPGSRLRWPVAACEVEFARSVVTSANGAGSSASLSGAAGMLYSWCI
jgi:hypothetical protein